MPDIYDDAYEGKLSADQLDRFLAGSKIDALNNAGTGSRLNGLTLLAAACWGSQLATVKLLLQKKAGSNALSAHQRPPLYFCTNGSPEPNRAEIVRLLLDAGANKDAQYPEDDNFTALMNAVTQIRDKNVIHELVDRGASLDLKNKQDQTVKDLAKGTPYAGDLRSKKERESSWGNTMDRIVGVVMSVLSYVNFGFIKGVANGLLERMFGYSGRKNKDNVEKAAEKIVGEQPAKELKEQLDKPPAPNPPPPPPTEQQTIAEYQNTLDDYVKNTGLEKFFGRDSKFLQTLAKKASQLKEDPKSFPRTPENLKKLTTLSLYKPIIYCDDSGSMQDDNRYEIQADLVARIARIATMIVPDDLGVNLRFINNHSGGMDNINADDILAKVHETKPNGATPIGTTLKKQILEPMVYSRINKGEVLERPLLICTITDGCPTREREAEFRDAIVACKTKLDQEGYEPTAVRFCVSQIGNDKDADEFLQGLRDDPMLEEVLYCTTDRLDDMYKDLRQNESRLEQWLLEVLTKPIMDRADAV